MKVLQMVSCAYRATIEEQDDTILWLTQAMKGAGGELDVLLSGNAVNYAIAGQDASGLAFGDWRQTQPPRVDDDIARMLAKGIEVFAVTDDLADRGLADATLIKGVHRVPRSEVARLMTAYDRVWRW
jgi:sulfur transfer complex TusBCD TusB component (DsrH family)